MEISSKEVFQIFDFTPKGKEFSFGDICRKFSEKTSSQSVPSDPKEVWLKDFSILQHPHGALAVLLALAESRTNWSCAERYEKILTHIYNLCRNHMFQGGWYHVAEVLSHDLLKGSVRYSKEIVRNMSKEDFFGNLLPLAYRIVESNLCTRSMLKAQRELTKREKYRGIRRKIRRRGYDDKGSLKFPHKWLPGRDFTLDEKEEKRKKFLEEVPKLRLSPPRYWYRSTFGDGPNDSTK